jgi:hypothetical protein
MLLIDQPWVDAITVGDVRDGSDTTVGSSDPNGYPVDSTVTGTVYQFCLDRNILVTEV